MISMVTAMSTATTAALFAAALGSSAGSANYSLAADINGDGTVNLADEVILASDYGFTCDDGDGSHDATRTTRSSILTSTHETPPSATA